MDRRAETDSSDGRRDQLDPSAREANAEVQSGSYFGCLDRPDAFYRVVFHSVEHCAALDLPAESVRNLRLRLPVLSQSRE